ncbi:MAG TPA: helix-turn-helix domain-containing protein [Opitutaceae bacterium]|nr:helix-turn-helix domain-containing protein [Opitutaceae bacterium]
MLRRNGKLTEFDLEPKFRGEPVATGAAADGAPAAAPAPLSLSVEENEKHLLHEALIKSRGNRTKAAKFMGISRRTLHRKLSQWPELDVIDR